LRDPMLSRFVLTLVLATASALQLGTSLPRAPVAPRAAMPAMQVPEAATEAVADQTELQGVVVPVFSPLTSQDMTPASAAHLEKLLAAKPDLGIVFRRAEFWTNETATLLEVLNVLGRFERAADFKERTRFSEVENARRESAEQGETKERYEMAQRMGCSERVGLYINAPSLPFTNAALAASVGLTVEDFAELEVSKAACNVVYDALAESRAGLIPYDKIDQRRGGMLDGEAAFNEIAFRSGLYKSRSLVILAWFLFGKGNFVWVLVSVKFLHDWKPDLIPSPVDMGLFKIGTFI